MEESLPRFPEWRKEGVMQERGNAVPETAVSRIEVLERVFRLYRTARGLLDVEGTIRSYSKWLSEYCDVAFLVYRDSRFAVETAGSGEKDERSSVYRSEIDAIIRGDWVPGTVDFDYETVRIHGRILSGEKGNGFLVVAIPAESDDSGVGPLLDESIVPLTDALTRAFVYERLSERAGTDAITGLPNRHLFEDQIRHWIEQAQRFGRSLTLATFDLDGFKTINDTRGHAAGDSALKNVAEAMLRSRRGSDFVARIGGDEFAAILPETDPVGAEVFVTRVRDSIEERAIPSGDGVLSTSAGIAEWRETMTSQQLLEDADRRLYEDKRHRKTDVR